MNQYEKDNQRLSAPHSPSLPFFTEHLWLFSWFSRFPSFIGPTFSTFQSSFFIIHSFIAGVYPPPYRCILSDPRHPGLTDSRPVGRGNLLWITYLLCLPHKDMEGLPDEGSAQSRGHLRDNTNMKDDTHHSRSHSFQQGEYERMIMTVKLYSGTLWALELPDVCLTGEEKLRKKSHLGSLSRPGVEHEPAA